MNLLEMAEYFEALAEENRRNHPKWADGIEANRHRAAVLRAADAVMKMAILDNGEGTYCCRICDMGWRLGGKDTHEDDCPVAAYDAACREKG